MPVTVFERKRQLGGIVRHVIPAFRIPTSAIEKDAALARAVGAQFELGAEIGSAQELLDRGYTDVILATGAWKPGKLPLEYGGAMNVIEFLERCKSDPDGLSLGENVVVIGGGNTAMDAARAAVRAPGVKKVPARLPPQPPLHARRRGGARARPFGRRRVLRAARPGRRPGRRAQVRKDGPRRARRVRRRSPVPTGETAEMPADILVIAAVGERVDTALYERCGVAVDSRGRAVVDPRHA